MPERKKEILERVPVHDAVDEHAQLVAFKIDAVIAEAEAVQDVARRFRACQNPQVRWR